MENENGYPGTRWLMLAAVAVGQVMIGTTLICYAPILGIIAGDIGVSVGEISAAAMGTIIMAAAISSILSGPILDKFGVARVITLGALITTMGVLLAPVFDNSLREIILVRLIMGMGWGPVTACTSTVAARWFPVHQRGIVAGMVGAGISLGIILGFILTPAFMDAMGHWSLAIRSLVVIPGIALILAFATNFLTEPEIHETVTAEYDSHKISSDVALAFKSLPTYVGILCMFLFTWYMNAFNDLTPGFIAIEPPTGLGMGPAVAGHFMSAVQVGMLLGSAASGFILMKIFKGRIKPVLITGFLFSGVFMFAVKFPLVNSAPPLLTASLFLAGFFEAFIIPMVATFIATNYPSTIMGRIYGTTFGISIFGGAIGVFVGSTFLHMTGTYMISITMVGVVALLGMVASFGINPPKVFTHID
ncbi:MAG: MFS transporter [Proteobacteria bacterium]|nr:MFS transporter [Pseudomonadota bacterium]